MLVYYGQTDGWIKMKLGMEVGLGLGDVVLDADPALPRQGAQQPPTFEIHGVRIIRGPYLLWPNG